MRSWRAIVAVLLVTMLWTSVACAQRGISWDRVNKRVKFANPIYVTSTGISYVMGSLNIAGDVTLGSAVGDTVTVEGTTTFKAPVTLGDAAGDGFTLTGYLTRLRVGTGSTADLVHGADDAFVEGQLEADGAYRLDGSGVLGKTTSQTLTVNAATTFAHSLTVTAAKSLTVPDSFYATRWRIGTGSTPGDSNATAADGLLVEGAAEVDGALSAHGNVALGNSASADTVTVTADITLDAGTAITSPDGAYFTQLRIGTGSTPGVDAATAADGFMCEGAAEIDGPTALHGILTATADADFSATGGSTGDPDVGISGYAHAYGVLEVDGILQADGGVGTAAGTSVSVGAAPASTTALVFAAVTGMANAAADTVNLYLQGGDIYAIDASGNTTKVADLP